MIGGVGDIKVTSPHGHYSVRLPIHDGRLATFSGVCLDVITGPLPPYPVREVRKSIPEMAALHSKYSHGGILLMLSLC